MVSKLFAILAYFSLGYFFIQLQYLRSIILVCVLGLTLIHNLANSDRNVFSVNSKNVLHLKYAALLYPLDYTIQLYRLSKSYL